MPPKRRGRPPKPARSLGDSLESFTAGNENKNDVSMEGTSLNKGKGKATSSRNALPDVYQDMLGEALPAQSAIPERPLKRRKTGAENRTTTMTVKTDDEEDFEFEDVLVARNEGDSDISEFEAPKEPQQTAYRDSDEDSDDSDHDWNALDFDTLPPDDVPRGDLELTLKPKTTPQRQKVTPRRKAVSKAEKALRLEAHKMHVLCLLAHLDRRNEWCNDDDVKKSLKPLVDKKMLTFLRPKSDLPQFGRTEALKRGLEMASKMWRTKFNITARGARRALWADDEKDVQNYRPPEDADGTVERSDFRAAAKTLKGSRDLGAQLFCSLLRSVQVEARLVCSLQPLSFSAGGPPMPRSTAPVAKPVPTEDSDEEQAVTLGAFARIVSGTSAAGLPVAPRRRLGHPNAAAYHAPEVSAPPRMPPKLKRKVIHESPFPVFWVEVFDEAYQKWVPVDPLVTETIAKPRALEPPGGDRENSLSYVITFEEEGCARDVTRRYTKAYNAKTRKNRVESTPGGERWWRRTMRNYARGYHNDADQIEDGQLASAEAQEPMPKNIVDFKDHPYYALERHLRRNEVLVRTREVGKVAAGRDPGTPGGKKLESIYRRRDVKIAKSSEAWYRLGRDVKMGEQPVKTVAPKIRPGDEDLDEGDDERAGTNLYTEEQTELFVPPPVVNGQVPKNSFHNIDVYVPSMVPAGGVHITDEETARAASILGIDYAPALTGFEFKGRHGTAVIKGAVVAVEYREAVEAVIEAFRDERARLEERMRSHAALRMWKRLFVTLRIMKDIETRHPIEDEETGTYKEKFQGDGDEEPESAQESIQAAEDDSGMDTEEYYDDEEGGGFLIE